MKLSVALFFALITKDVYAYLDPGTGSLIIQFVIGGVLSVVFLVKAYWFKLKTLFRKSNSPLESKVIENKKKRPS